MHVSSGRGGMDWPSSPQGEQRSTKSDNPIDKLFGRLAIKENSNPAAYNFSSLADAIRTGNHEHRFVFIQKDIRSTMKPEELLQKGNLAIFDRQENIVLLDEEGEAQDPAFESLVEEVVENESKSSGESKKPPPTYIRTSVRQQTRDDFEQQQLEQKKEEERRREKKMQEQRAFEESLSKYSDADAKRELEETKAEQEFYMKHEQEEIEKKGDTGKQTGDNLSRTEVEKLKVDENLEAENGHRQS